MASIDGGGWVRAGCGIIFWAGGRARRVRQGGSIGIGGGAE